MQNDQGQMLSDWICIEFGQFEHSISKCFGEFLGFGSGRRTDVKNWGWLWGCCWCWEGGCSHKSSGDKVKFLCNPTRRRCPETKCGLLFAFVMSIEKKMVAKRTGQNKPAVQIQTRACAICTQSRPFVRLRSRSHTCEWVQVINFTM